MTVNMGMKRVCASCSAKFYDLGRNPAPCPKCKTSNDINAPVRARRKARATVEVDLDDPLIKNKAKQDARQKVKKIADDEEEVDLDGFEDIEPMDGDDDIEEIDDMDEDIESLEELEDAEGEEELEDEGVLEEEVMGDDAFIDELGEEELEEAEEEEEEEKPAPKASKRKK